MCEKYMSNQLASLFVVVVDHIWLAGFRSIAEGRLLVHTGYILLSGLLVQEAGRAIGIAVCMYPCRKVLYMYKLV